jgi:hypothetical protein
LEAGHPGNAGLSRREGAKIRQSASSRQNYGHGTLTTKPSQQSRGFQAALARLPTFSAHVAGLGECLMAGIIAIAE